MFLRSEPRRQARLLVDVLADLLLDTSIKWQWSTAGLQRGVYQIWDDFSGLRIDNTFIPLPLLQSWRLRRALKTRVRFEARILAVEQIKREAENES